MLRAYFTPCSNVSIVNFDHVIAGLWCSDLVKNIFFKIVENLEKNLLRMELFL